MTHRRSLLKAALAAPAAALTPSLPVAAAPLAVGGDADLFALYADWLTYDAEMSATFPALAAAETSASARGVDWDDCLAVRMVLARQEAFWRAQQDALYDGAARPAVTLDGVALKLAFWRRANPDVRHGQFTDGWDRLTFSAYDDLIAMTGRADLAHEGDEKMRGEVRELKSSF